MMVTTPERFTGLRRSRTSSQATPDAASVVSGRGKSLLRKSEIDFTPVPIPNSGPGYPVEATPLINEALRTADEVTDIPVGYGEDQKTDKTAPEGAVKESSLMSEQITLMRLSVVVEVNPFQFHVAKGSPYNAAWQKVVDMLIEGKALPKSGKNHVHALQVLLHRYISEYYQKYEKDGTGRHGVPAPSSEKDKLAQQLYEYKRERPPPPLSKKQIKEKGLLQRKQAVELGMRSGLTNADLRDNSSDSDDDDTYAGKQGPEALEEREAGRLNKRNIDMECARDIPAPVKKKIISPTACEMALLSDTSTSPESENSIIANTDTGKDTKWRIPQDAGTSKLGRKLTGKSLTSGIKPRIARVQQRENLFQELTQAAVSLSDDSKEREHESARLAAERQMRLDEIHAAATEKEKDRAEQRERDAADRKERKLEREDRIRREDLEREERGEERRQREKEQDRLFNTLLSLIRK